MDLLNLDAWTIAQLQTCRALLVTATEQGLDLPATLEAVSSRIGPESMPVVSGALCPSCGRGQVVLWAKTSVEVGLPVFGCLRCRWSEVR